MFGRRDIKLPDMPRQLSELRVPELHVPSLEFAGVRTPALEIGGDGPFVRRRRANPIWRALKFVAGVGVGFAFGCLAAALLAPAAGEDTRQMIREKLPGGKPELPDAGLANTGTITRGTRLTADGAAGGGAVARLRARFERAREAMKIERRERENALFVRFRQAQQTGRASEL